MNQSQYYARLQHWFSIIFCQCKQSDLFLQGTWSSTF